MRKEPNKKLIGIFMLTGLAVLAIVFGIYIKGKVFAGGKTLVMYFEESINGLNVGSPVVFKGVQIGKVVSIDLIANPENLEFSIPVYVKMEQKKNIEDMEFGDRETVLNELIKKGLRARLTTQSYLTGLLMIELEMLPSTPIELHHRKNNRDVLEVPTVLSQLGELSKGIQDLPVRESVVEFNKFFSKLNTDIMPQLQQTMTDVNRLISGRSGASADTLVNINRTLSSMSEAARSVRNLTDYLEQHPEALLKGKGGR